VDNLANDIGYLINGLNEIKNEIEIVEKIEAQKDLFNDYLENLIKFASEAIEEVEILNDSYEELNKKIIIFAVKMGEKKTTKLKDLLLPISCFFRSFKN